MITLVAVWYILKYWWVWVPPLILYHVIKYI